MNPEYRILEKTYYDEYGNKKRRYYTIQYRKKILWFKYWKSVTHTIGSISGTFDTITEFETMQQAKEFVEKNIWGDGIYDQLETKIINQ
jgi:hypothetical protein